jgi:ATP-dependent RNA helicase DDX23/PRP28
VLAPTRELVLQIAEEARKLGSGIGVQVVSIVGGESIETQGMQLRQGCHVIVATPGRLKDCLERRYCVLQQCNYVVLDEADRMVDMGFEEDLQFILKCMEMEPLSDAQRESESAQFAAEPEEIEADLTQVRMTGRTTILYSATMPPSVEQIARTYLHRPVSVTIGSAGKAVDRIEQRCMWIPGLSGRQTRLLSDLRSCSPPAIVFCNQKKDCDALMEFLKQKHISATVLHSGKSQDIRESNLHDFRSGRKDVLVATNVAGRGIDIPGVTLVVNFDCPASIEDYTHRIGRTGRAGTSGVAVTYISEADSQIFYDLKKFLDSSPKAIYPQELRGHAASRIKPGSLVDRHGKDIRGVE